MLAPGRGTRSASRGSFQIKQRLLPRRLLLPTMIRLLLSTMIQLLLLTTLWLLLLTTIWFLLPRTIRLLLSTTILPYHVMHSL
jgi:hypothetical protein